MGWVKSRKVLINSEQNSLYLDSPDPRHRVAHSDSRGFVIQKSGELRCKIWTHG